MPDHPQDHRQPSPLGVWDEATVERHLTDAGEHLAPEVADRIVAQRDHVVPMLVEVLEDVELAEEDAPGEGYAPLHAADLLLRLQAAEAIVPLLGIALDYQWESLMFNRSVTALKDFGPAAFDPVMEAFRETDDPEIQAVLVEILGGLGHRDEEIWKALTGFLAIHPEQAAMALADYGDSRAIPLLSDVCDGLDVDADDGGEAADRFFEIAHAFQDLDGTLSPAQQSKLERAAVRRMERWRPLASRRGSVVRPGRNEPCWCGSGRKYKKCHLDSDRGP